MRSLDGTLVGLVRARSVEQPDRDAYIFLDAGGAERGRMTYAQLDLRVRAIAAQLQEHVAVGDRVLLLFTPSLEFMSAFHACLYAGAIPVPCYPAQTPQDAGKLAAIAGNAGTRIVLCDDPVLARAKPMLAAAPQPLSELTWLSVTSIADTGASHWREPALTPESLALLQYTSGSTGVPKGVMVTHRNLLHNFQVMTEAFGHHRDTTVATWLPLFHDMGLIGNALQACFTGVTCVLMSPVDFIRRPALWLQAITRHRVTFSGAPNFAYDLCARRITEDQRAGLDLSSWTVAFNGAEPIRAEVLDRFTARFAPCGFRRESMYPCYGLAEGTLFVSGGDRTAPPVRLHVDRRALEDNRVVPAEGPEARALVGCGHTWSRQSLHIVDPATLEVCPPDRVGEIWVEGESVAAGYWQQPQLSSEVFPTELAGIGAGRFLRTGDLGFVRDDELYVTGRLKDLIIIRGRNHSPEDIERTVERCNPALRPGCGAAFAIEGATSERLVLVYEVSKDHQRGLDDGLLLGDVRAAVASMHDLQVHALCLIAPGTIPKTSSGKIQRRACRRMYLDDTLPVISLAGASNGEG